MRTSKLVYTDGAETKGIDFDQYPDDAWYFHTEPPQTDAQVLYSSVAAVFRAANITADTVSTMPFAIMRGDQEYDVSDDYQNKVGFMPDPRHLLRLWRLSLFMTNQAYGFMEGNRVKSLLRYLVPETIEPIVDEADGLTGFRRKVGNKLTTYPLEEKRIFWIWRLDHTTELLPAKSTEMRAISAAAGSLYYIDYFMQHFFKRGGIKPTMLMVSGATNTAEREKLERAWDRLYRGITDYLGKVFRADAITPIVIGEGVDNLKDQTIYQDKLSDIAMASGIPLSLLLANSANYATAQVEYKSWFDNSITPWLRFMEDAMNTQLFEPRGLRWEFRPEVTDPGQEDEVSRAGAYQAYVNAGMLPSIAAQVVGIELPSGIEYEDLDPEEEPEPEPEMEQEETEEIPVVEESDSDEEQEEQPVKFVPNLDQFRELELWQTLAFRKHKRGEMDGFIFETKELPVDIAGLIANRLQDAETEDDIKRAFDVINTPEPAAKSDLVILAEAINRAVEEIGADAD
jgi:hypothetical protein